MAHPLEFLRRRYLSGEKRPGFGLAMNIGSLTPGLVPLMGDIVVRSATVDEVEDLRRLFEYYGSFRDLHRQPFETRVIATPVRDVEGATNFQYEELSPDELRYHVIEYPGVNGLLYALRQASVFTSNELYLGPEIHTDNQGAGPGCDVTEFAERVRLEDDAFENWTAHHVADLGNVCQCFLRHDRTTIDLQRASDEYLRLRRVGRHSNLQFLGLFTIIEFLLTTEPKGGERYDSIAKQVARKVNLLENRCSGLSYASFRDKPPKETAWRLLYKLRSAIAHGRAPDFADELQAVVDLNTSEQFIRAALKMVMRRALEEPQLVADLRDC